jgi:dihydroorotase/N-acyl-D-amino-acid deacylase
MSATRLLLQNGLLFDGTGAQPIRGDVLIDAGRIVQVGVVRVPAGCPVLDCSSLAIAPGFIDLHSHADLQVLQEARTEKVLQGVTTEVVGNCGFSPFPQGDHPQALCEFGGGILGERDGWGWQSAAEYLEAAALLGKNVRIAPLVGHGSLRVAVAGLRQGQLTQAELDRLSGMLDDALAAGCAGFSTGLMYAPGSSAGKPELEHLCRVVAKSGKLYATHMRSYASGLLDALREQLDLARATDCRLQISHLQAAGRANWDLQRQALDEIEAARAEGIDVEFDIYPYQCGSTVLTQWLPQWALDGGTDALMGRLHDADTREQICAATERSRSQEWSDVTISGVASHRNAGLVGKTIAEAAELRGQAGVDAVVDLLVEENAAVNVISFNQSESNLRQLLTHPLCSVISDGFYVNGKPHPRLHGTFPELLGTMVRERRWMNLAEAVHKITGKPASRLRLSDRGLLREGYAADLCIFDPEHIRSRATYEEPDLPPEGIAFVFRNGDMQAQARPHS